MGDRRGDVAKNRSPEASTESAVDKTRERLRELCECEKIIEDEEVLALGRINREVEGAEDNVSSCDEVDESLEAERRRLNDVLELPVDTYSLTLISPNLPTCVKYGVRSGLAHHRMHKFSPLSKGLQGPAIAIAAFATTALMKARCWNELIIDQIVEDGDTYYCESYDRHHTDDRRTLTVLDLNRDFIIQKTHRVYVNIDEPAYAGTFRSENPRNLHVAKALELFFNRYDAGVLVSSVLNIAVWRDAKYFNIFDAQARRDNLLPTDDPSGGAKLILVRDMTGVLFVVLEKSTVKNEHFVICRVRVKGVHRLPVKEDDPDEPEKSVGEPRRRPSGYRIQSDFRALVQGSFHLNHELVPEELRGRGHLVIALAALIHSRLVPANKWTSAMIDLIFNQSHIYLVDLARVLEKKLDDTFDLKIDEVMGDVILGVYAAKVNVRINVVPGQGKKGKATIDSGIRDFFKANSLGILEIKKTFYAVWHDGGKYYFFDPFGCDDEGFRVDPTDPENHQRYGKALACVTMNSSVNELIETILENTGNKEKDPFIIHGLGVLYVKTGSHSDGALDTVIYREKKTNRRPLPPEDPKPEEPDDCKIVMDMIPRPRPDAERTKNFSSEYPELMKRVEAYMMREDEPTTFVEDSPETGDTANDKEDEEQPIDPLVNAVHDESVGTEKIELADTKAQVHFRNEMDQEESTELDTTQDGTAEDVQDENTIEEITEEPNEDPNEPESFPERIKYIKGYSIVNPHRLILHGTHNCVSEEFEDKYRGRQGLTLALTAIAYAKIKEPETWRNVDVDQIVRVGDRAHADVINWIRQGSPADADEDKTEEEDAGENEDEEEDEEAEEEDDDEDAEEGDDEETLRSFKGALKSTPSHLDVSMLPVRMKLGENKVVFQKRQSVIDGDADPLANLGEALQRYFGMYNEAILENKRLMYGVWKQDEKYFVLNPYGSDEEGWRSRDYPASVLVTDTIYELVDIFHSIFEFNDRKFSFHYVGVESIQPGDKYVSPVALEPPDVSVTEKYQTRFLPVTDEDLYVPELESEPQIAPIVEEDAKPVEDEEDEDDEEDDDEEEEEEEEEELEETEDRLLKAAEPEKPLEDPLLAVDEQEYPDAPERLNLSLLTGSVKIEEDVIPDGESTETLRYERLKYSHPPPYVIPPKKVLCVLLEAKKASGSMHSLISRFSIDSKLAVKATRDLPAGKENDPAIAEVVSAAEQGKTSKLIKLPPKNYLFSRVPTIGYTPLRAINEKFIQDEDLDRAREEACRREKAPLASDEFVLREVPEDPIGVRIIPEIIPLGPTIKTPTPKKKPKPCAEHSPIRKCKISDAEKEDSVMRKILCDTEDLLLDVIFPKRKEEHAGTDPDDQKPENAASTLKDVESNISGVIMKADDNDASNEPEVPEIRGFLETKDKIGIIEANSCLENRDLIEACHFKQCFYAAILCILAKVRTSVQDFCGTILDQFVFAAGKIHRRIGKLRYKRVRWFRNVVVLRSKGDVITKQAIYADPENCEADDLSITLESYLVKNQSGILVFENASYAFWTSNGRYYLFDPYACDDTGRANENGIACLLKFCDFDGFVQRVRENNATQADKPYRVYSLSIAHVEPIKIRKKSSKKRKKQCPKTMSEESMQEELLEDPPDESLETKRELSLIELPEWIDNEEESTKFDLTVPGFAAIKNHNASALEVPVVENDITRPLQAPLKKLEAVKTPSSDPLDPPRKKPYDRKFKEETCIGEAIDLCIIAWSCVHDPTVWSVRTIRGIYEASKDLTYDSLLTATDTNPADMIDGVLTEFSIGNYYFRAVFAPLHRGKLYAMEGWNLAMSLKKLLEIRIYSGAILICDKSHIGIMKKGSNHYAWWTVPNTKNLRIVTSRILEDFLKLVVKAIGTREERDFVMRIVTISYARKLDPDCSDMYGLHEAAIPSRSLAQIHRKASPPYDLQAIFRPTLPRSKPIFVLGTVALEDRDGLIEPRVKRCYYVALLSIMIKRDIVQSPMPAMIDRVLEVADNLYGEFDDAKYHTEHVLRNVTLMNRIFDFRDCASPLSLIRTNPNNGQTDFYSVVRKQLRKHFVRHTDGLIHFTNCSYGFWYSRATNAYYYIDPYACNDRGRRVGKNGAGCLAIFPSICQMVKQWCVNRFQDTTGFFIHRVHVESINVPPCDKFTEDPMWVYLDYQWSFEHSTDSTKSSDKPKRKRKTATDEVCKETDHEERARPSWNNYTIEVPNLIYSIWGTVGSYDARFGDRAGRNRDAVCVAVLSMQYLCHPSRWGAAILDSAVICGDSYYTESTKNSAKRGSRYQNPFNLQPCFKVFPHIWRIEFLPNICGILYGARDRPGLATILKIAFDESSNLVLQCDRVSLAILSTGNDFYVTDPCWTGPPLFVKNRGAAYALRCRNVNSLVYAVTKILNTNQRLEFRVTPIALGFSQEICKFVDRRGSARKEILSDPLGDEPGIADGPAIPVSGGIIQPGEDSFLLYRQNLKRGILHGGELENPRAESPVPPMNHEVANNCSISTTWHLNIGKDRTKKRSHPPADSSILARDSRYCSRENDPPKDPPKMSSIEEKIRLCDDYPRTIDFAAGKFFVPPTKILTRRNFKPEVPVTKPLDCLPRKRFLTKTSDREFDKWTKEMADEAYKTQKHGVHESEDDTDEKVASPPSEDEPDDELASLPPEDDEKITKDDEEVDDAAGNEDEKLLTQRAISK